MVLTPRPDNDLDSDPLTSQRLWLGNSPELSFMYAPKLVSALSTKLCVTVVRPCKLQVLSLIGQSCIIARMQHGCILCVILQAAACGVIPDIVSVVTLLLHVNCICHVQVHLSTRYGLLQRHSLSSFKLLFGFACTAPNSQLC